MHLVAGLWRYAGELQLQAPIPRNFIGSLHAGHTSPAGLCYKLGWCRHPAEEWGRARPPHLDAGKGRCSRRSLPPSRPRSLSVPQPIFQQRLLKPMGTSDSYFPSWSSSASTAPRVFTAPGGRKVTVIPDTPTLPLLEHDGEIPGSRQTPSASSMKRKVRYTNFVHPQT